MRGARTSASWASLSGSSRATVRCTILHGVLCYLRAHRPEAKDNALFYNNFETWRCSAPPLLVFVGGPRLLKARADQQDDEYEAIKVHEEVRQIMGTKLIKSHYKAHRVHGHDWLMDEASEFEKQSGEEDSGDNPRMCVKLREVIRVTQGKRVARHRDACGASTRCGTDGSDCDMSMQSSTKRPTHIESLGGARSVSSMSVTTIGKMRDTGLVSGASASVATHESPAPNCGVFMRERLQFADAARNKNAVRRLRSALMRLTKMQKTEFSCSPKHVLDNIEHAIANGYKRSMGELQLVAEALTHRVSRASDLDQAPRSGIQFFLDHGKNDSQEVQFQLRYHNDKVQNKLILSGDIEGKHFSKTLREVLRQNGGGKIGEMYGQCDLCMELVQAHFGPHFPRVC